MIKALCLGLSVTVFKSFSGGMPKGGAAEAGLTDDGEEVMRIHGI